MHNKSIDFHDIFEFSCRRNCGHSRTNLGRCAAAGSAQPRMVGTENGAQMSVAGQTQHTNPSEQRDSQQQLTLQQKQQIISESIRGIPDFPKAGILFWDVTTLLLSPQAFQCVIDLLVDRYKDQTIDAVAGFEARGFIFGAPLALALKCPFVPLRKPGKLPGETVSESYITEYSTDKIEMHTGAILPGNRVLLVDDLIATGGTLRAGINLIHKVKAEVVEAACVIELPALKGRDKLGDIPLFVLIEKEGE